MPEVHFLGTGNAFATQAKGHQSMLVAGPEGAWLLDCGPTTLLQMQRFGAAVDAITGIALTHLHGDHALGLPMVLLHFMYISRRQEPLDLVGPPGTAAYCSAAWNLAYPDVAQRPFPFELRIHELDGEKRETFELKGMRLETVSMRHSIPVNGYRVHTGGRTIALTGDTGPTPAIAELGAGTDFLIVECSFEEPFEQKTHISARELEEGLPYGSKKVAWIHTSPGVWSRRAEYQERLGVLLPEDGDRVKI